MSSWLHVRIEEIQTEVSKVLSGYLHYTPQFRRIRKETACALCTTAFKQNDPIGLALTNRGNLVICQSCVETAAMHGVPIQYKSP